MKQIRQIFQKCGEKLTGPYRVFLLLSFSVLCYVAHILLAPFPKRDALTYLHILHYWNTSGSYTQMLEKFPKFGLLLFPFLPLKYLEQIGVPLYPASVCWMLILSTLSVYLFYKIVLLVTEDSGKAMWCGALLAVHPMILYYAGSLLRDTPYLTSCLFAVLVFIYAVKQRRLYFYGLCGLALALCTCCRFEAWELLILFPVFAFFYAKRKDLPNREIIFLYLCAAGGFLLTWIILLTATDDLPLLYEKGRCMVLSFAPDWMGVK